MEKLAEGYGLIEGPVWDPALGLLFSDVLFGGVYRLAADGGVSTVFGHRRGIGGMALHEDGGLIVSGAQRFLQAVRRRRDSDRARPRRSGGQHRLQRPDHRQPRQGLRRQSGGKPGFRGRPGAAGGGSVPDRSRRFVAGGRHRCPVDERARLFSGREPSLPLRLRAAGGLPLPRSRRWVAG